MSRTSRVARRVIALGERNPLLPPQVADPWLVGLRWVAAFGMLGTTLLAKTLVPALDSRPILGLVAAVAALNLVWREVLRRAERTFVIEQLVCDMLLLGAILWFSGGVTNPFASFLTFQIALAGLQIALDLCAQRTHAHSDSRTIVSNVPLASPRCLPLAVPAPWPAAAR